MTFQQLYLRTRIGTKRKQRSAALFGVTGDMASVLENLHILVSSVRE